MLHVVSAGNRHLYNDQVEDWFRLRHKVYVEELKWSDVARDDGLECDQFDTDETTHLLSICENTGKVVAGTRINSSLGPTLTSDVFSELCNLEPAPIGPFVADWTRLCVSKEKRDGTGLCQEAREIYCGIMEYACFEGLTALTFVAHTYWVNRFTSVGFRVRLLGTPQPCEGLPTIAGVIDVNEKTLAKTRSLMSIGSSVLIHEGPRVPLSDVYDIPSRINQ